MLFHPVNIGRRQVDFVNGNHDRDICGLRVLNRFPGLGHQAVIGSNDNDRDVRQVRATCSHRGECGVPRSIEKADFMAIVFD